MDLERFKVGIAQLAEEKDIPEEKVIRIIEKAVAAAYKKDYGKSDQKIEAELDDETGKFKFWQVKEVVDEDQILTDEELEKLKQGEELEERKIRFHPERHVKAGETENAEPGDEIRVPLEAKKDYGRIAAQTAKQVILQRLKETERDMMYEEYKKKEGDVISGTVQRVSSNKVYFDLGDTLGMLTREEQIPGEYYEIGQRFKLYVLEVKEGTKGPVIYLSRAFPKFVSKLFELEVPEIASGEVEIKSIAREPGSRTKIAVVSHEEEVDPVGATIGQRGARVSAVISELGGEKIDISPFAEKPKDFVSNALSPAKVLQVKKLSQNKALAITPSDELSLAIGKEGQNVRLAAKLTGWKIDVQSVEEWEEEQESSEEEVEAEEKEEKSKEEKEEVEE